MDTEEELFGLIAVAKEQQAAAQALVDGLPARIESCIQTAINRALETEAGRAAAAIQHGIRPAADRLKDAAEQAGSAAIKVNDAASWLTLKSFGVLVGIMGLAGLLLFGLMNRAVTDLKETKERLAYYQQEEERMKWKLPPKIYSCEIKGEKSRPCVKVMTHMGSYGDKSDIMILAEPPH